MAYAGDAREDAEPTPQDAAAANPPQDPSAEHSLQEDVSDELVVDNAEKSIERSRSKILLIMLALGCTVFLHALDVTIIATALPTITESFHSEAAYTWIGSAYLLAIAATTIVWSKVSDVFGRKPVLLLTIVIFFIGSLIAALSINIGMLIAARAIQGCGGGGLNVLVNVCIGDLFSPRRRGTYYSIIGGVWAVALSLGPIVGGILTQRVSWRWCFYLNLPFDGLAFIIIVLFLDLKTPKTAFVEGISAIDWVGAFLSVGGTILLLFGLSSGGETYPWNSATVVCLIVFGIVCWVLCFFWEIHLAKYPILPVRIFRHRSSLAALGICFIQSYVYFAATYYLPLYFQAVLGVTPILSGLYLLPTALSVSVASTAAGIYMRKTGQYVAAIWIGLVLQTLGYGLFIDLGPTANWAKIIFQVVAGLGVGPNFQAPLVALQSFSSPRDVATVTSATVFTRNLGGSISVVIGQVVFQNEMSKRQGILAAALGPQLAARLGGGAAGANTEVIRTLPPGQRDVVHTVFTESLRCVWIMYTAFSAAGLAICFLVGNNKLSRDHKETKTGLEAEEEARQERMQEEQDRKGVKASKTEA